MLTTEYKTDIVSSPAITVICPVFNEEKHIERVLEFFTRALPANKELIVVDAGSTDQTLSIFRNWESKHRGIRLLHNPRRHVSFALNDAIKILAAFEKTGADIVGGPTRTAYSDPMQEAVAYAICTRFAIGNSRVHLHDYEGFTDSVTFGSWKKNIFNVTGLFDERLKRNQDDEFHYRAKSFGFSIYQSPDIKLYYYPRNSLKGLYRQYYEYGLYKPMVLKKVNSGLQWRHLVPSLFVVYLFTLFLAIAYPFWLLPLALYLFVNVLFMLRSRKTIAVMCRLFFVYMTIHVGYGLGFLSGLRKII